MVTDMIPPAAAPAFLAQAGWGHAAIVPLAGDASFRRYFRVIDGARRAVLMDAPPPHEDPRPFIAIAEHLTANGFAAPRILARDLEEGLVLIEDFGDLRVKEHVEDVPDAEDDVYRRAVDLLAALHRLPAAEVPPYDRAVYQREAGLLTEWYCPAIGLPVDEAGYVAAWDAVLPVVERSASPVVTVLRDYHAENIMLIDRAASHGLGLLDFQDALAGHPAYDLVSLLQDARRDVPPALEAAMLDHYRAIANPRPISTPPMPCWGRSATRRSSASSPVFGSAMASRAICPICRACGTCWNATSPIPSWPPWRRGLRPTSPPKSAIAP